MIGRFFGAALLRRVATGVLLGIFATAASTLVFASVLMSGGAAMWSILLVGLFNSIMFPSIFTLAIDGLGPLTGKGSGLLVTAIVGGSGDSSFARRARRSLWNPLRVYSACTLLPLYHLLCIAGFPEAFRSIVTCDSKKLSVWREACRHSGGQSHNAGRPRPDWNNTERCL